MHADLAVDDALDLVAAVVGELGQQDDDGDHEDGDVLLGHLALELDGDVAHVLLQPGAPEEAGDDELGSDPEGVLLLLLHPGVDEALHGGVEDDGEPEGDAEALEALDQHGVEGGGLVGEGAQQQEGGRDRRAQLGQQHEQEGRGGLHLREAGGVLVVARRMQALEAQVLVKHELALEDGAELDQRQPDPHLLPGDVVRARDEGADRLDRVVGDRGLARRQEGQLHGEELLLVREDRHHHHGHDEDEEVPLLRLLAQVLGPVDLHRPVVELLRLVVLELVRRLLVETDHVVRGARLLAVLLIVTIIIHILLLDGHSEIVGGSLVVELNL